MFLSIWFFVLNSLVLLFSQHVYITTFFDKMQEKSALFAGKMTILL